MMISLSSSKGREIFEDTRLFLDLFLSLSVWWFLYFLLKGAILVIGVFNPVSRFIVDFLARCIFFGLGIFCKLRKSDVRIVSFIWVSRFSGLNFLQSLLESVEIVFSVELKHEIVFLMSSLHLNSNNFDNQCIFDYHHYLNNYLSLWTSKIWSSSHTNKASYMPYLPAKITVSTCPKISPMTTTKALAYFRTNPDQRIRASFPPFKQSTSSLRICSFCPKTSAWSRASLRITSFSRYN